MIDFHIVHGERGKRSPEMMAFIRSAAGRWGFEFTTCTHVAAERVHAARIWTELKQSAEHDNGLGLVGWTLRKVE